MKETENYNLKQIENDDKPSEYPSVQSENMQVIDEQLKAANDRAESIEGKVESLEDSIITTKSTQGPAYGPLVSVTAEGHAEQDGTPTPSDPKEIVVVRGRNLLPITATSHTVNGITFTVNADGSVTVSGTASANASLELCGVKKLMVNAGTYVLSGCPAGGSNSTWFLQFRHVSSDYKTRDYGDGGSFTLDEPMTINSVDLVVINGTAITTPITFYPQLELGSTAHPYVPYGHVGLDVTANGTTTTTPIPLPSRGWVGSLPDGTHDALAIDGAGKVSWELGVYGRVLDGTDMSGLAVAGAHASDGGGFYELVLEGTTGATLESYVYLTARNSMSNRLTKVNGQGLSGDNHGIVGYWQNNWHLRFRPVETDEAQTKEVLQTWLTSNPTSFYLPMQVKSTVEVGHVDMPDIPEGAVVSMPELEGLGVESWTSDAVARYVRAWAARR